MKFSAEPVSAPELAALIDLAKPPVDVTFVDALPFLLVAEKAGTISYVKVADLATDGVQVDRTETSAIDADAVATGSVEYALKLYEKRCYIAEREESNFGDVERLKIAGGKTLSGKFFRGLEKGFVAYLIAAVAMATQLEQNGIIAAVSEAADEMRVFGVPRLFMTAKCFRALKANAEIKKLLEALGPAGLSVDYILGKPAAVKAAITDLTGVDKICIADSAVWGSEYDDEFFMVGVRPETLGEAGDVIGTMKSKPLGGFIPYAMPVGESAVPFQPASIRLHGNMETKRNEFDADATMAFVNVDKKSVRRFKLPVGA